MSIFFAVIISYLIGSVPTAYLFGKVLKGVDIRDYGSGNVGATNAFRVLGKTPGTVVLLLDIVKGVLPLTVIGDMLGIHSSFIRVLLGVVVVAGHNWTVFLNFKGGKGIATSLGVLIGLTIQFPTLRPVLTTCLLLWITSFLVTGFVSLSSMIAAVVLPVAMAVTSQPFEMIVLGVVFCIFIVLRHRGNIKRLLAGDEPKVNFPFNRSKS